MPAKPGSATSSPRKPRNVKQVLITIARDGVEEWTRFEAYCKKYNVNKSRLIRNLVGYFLKEEAGKSEQPYRDAGRFVG